jgi:hypothetical protein
MRHPIVEVCWRQAARIRRQARDIATLSAAYKRATADLAAQEQAAERWRSRCLSIYLIADPELRDGVMRSHSDIEVMTKEADR